MSRRIVIFGWADSIHVQRWVRGLKDRGYQIRLISLAGKPIDGIETFILPRKNKLSYFLQAGEAARLAKEFKPDLVHVHYAGGFGLWGLKCNFAPLLVSVWGADVIDLPTNPIQRYFIRRILKRANRISATSGFLKHVCEKLLPATAARTTVIPFGVSLPDRASPLPSEPIKLCFIKAHRPKYGPEILLRALALATQTIPTIQLTMAGEGAMTAELKLLASQLGLADRVDFVGFVPNDKIYSLLQAHHLMVMPSVMDSESFGVAVLEASACGRPVIATRVGGVPEVLQDGKTGLLVAPNNVDALAAAIVELASDLDRCRRMGEAGREFVEANYVWERSLDMMSSLYEEVSHGR